MKNNQCNGATCASCLFGRVVQVAEKSKKSKATKEMCECHVSRPTRYGFPVVRTDDFCSLHVDAATMTRTYAAIAAGLKVES